MFKLVLTYLKQPLIKKTCLFKFYLKTFIKNRYTFYLIQRNERVLQIS